MYKVNVVTHNWAEVGVVVFSADGCIELRISDSGCISATFYDGVSKVYKMRAGDTLTRVQMTDDEIYATDGLGDWYRDQVAQLDAKAAEEAGEAATTDTAQ